ncbi:hypothetical protein FHR70_001150 [Microvirga lupini]|uniref:Uncharacterized protein n=1 Tax=Microvirga lupini TaxID=420324 RepID=A0A7W4YV73_9HYPH|nr:hypothetical protein [Microvirga lupini]MBB3018110.1 hypothetical protein [Microvirga lupini]
MKKLSLLAGVSAMLLAQAGADYAQEKYTDDVIRVGVMSDMAGVYSDSRGAR